MANSASERWICRLCNWAGAGLGGLLALALASQTVVGAHAAISGLPAGSPGCGRAATSGWVAASTEDGNHTRRSYRVQIPTGYATQHPYPVTFVFHAAGGSADDAIGWGLQNVAGAAAAGIFVFPTGIDFNHEGPGWDDRSDGYDLPFFDHMLAELESDWCVDPKSVFVTGFSWGGDFTVALACNRGDKIRAVAAYSTSDEFKDPADFSSYADLPCAAKRHPAILFVHAEDGDDKYPPPYFATTSALLRHLNACGAVSTPAASSPVMACRSYRRCSSPVTECSFEHRLGHTLPPHWAEDTWTFFRSQSR